MLKWHDSMGKPIDGEKDKHRTAPRSTTRSSVLFRFHSLSIVANPLALPDPTRSYRVEGGSRSSKGRPPALLRIPVTDTPVQFERQYFGQAVAETRQRADTFHPLSNFELLSFVAAVLLGPGIFDIAMSTVMCSVTIMVIWDFARTEHSNCRNIA